MATVGRMENPVVDLEMNQHNVSLGTPGYPYNTEWLVRAIEIHLKSIKK